MARRGDWEMINDSQADEGDGEEEAEEEAAAEGEKEGGGEEEEEEEEEKKKSINKKAGCMNRSFTFLTPGYA